MKYFLKTSISYYILMSNNLSLFSRINELFPFVLCSQNLNKRFYMLRAKEIFCLSSIRNKTLQSLFSVKKEEKKKKTYFQGFLTKKENNECP